MNDERYKDITVRMLMNHTSGISMGLSTNHYLYDDVDSFVHDNTLDIVSGQRFKAAPGEYACYNKYGTSPPLPMTFMLSFSYLTCSTKSQPRP